MYRTLLNNCLERSLTTANSRLRLTYEHHAHTGGVCESEQKDSSGTETLKESRTQRRSKEIIARLGGCPNSPKQSPRQPPSLPCTAGSATTARRCPPPSS